MEESDYDNDYQDEDEQEEYEDDVVNENYRNNAQSDRGRKSKPSKQRNPFDRKLNYHFLRNEPKSNQYKKGKSVLVNIGAKQVRGWVHEISEKKVLVRYQVKNNKSTIKMMQKWFSKQSKKIELCSRS